MNKPISSEFIPQDRMRLYSTYPAFDDETYAVDKGELTSRECGKLLKGMVSDYEKRLIR